MVGDGCLDEEHRSTYTEGCLGRCAPTESEPELTVPLVASFLPSELSNPARFCHAVYAAARGQGLTQEAAVLLTTHMAHSTGFGKAAYNYMLAGVKAKGGRALCRGEAADPGVNYICMCSSERAADGSWVAGCPEQGCDQTGRPRCKYPFRAYGSVAEAVAAVVANLKRPKYKLSWAYLVAGSTQYFRQIGYDGWYTGWTKDPEKTYQDWLVTLARVRKYLGAPPPTESVALLFWVAAGLGLTWWARKKGWV
jgi:hypothetical protein